MKALVLERKKKALLITGTIIPERQFSRPTKYGSMMRPAHHQVRRAGRQMLPNSIAGYDAAALGMRLRELRWKNRAWLATAETIAGWNGFEIRNAGSGRSPVRKRSG
jgi:hypothetical protein